MKAKTTAFHKLINSTGFGWSSETNTVTANENVWSIYLKATGVFGRALIQGPLYSDEEMYVGGGPLDVGGGPSMFPMDAAYVHGSGGKTWSSKQSRSSLDALMETMSETSCAKKAHYHTKAMSAEAHHDQVYECLEKYANFRSSIWPRCREVNIGQ
ncbi:hypothetical protein LguiA_001721 [Lonicera macranthoides]